MTAQSGVSPSILAFQLDSCTLETSLSIGEKRVLRCCLLVCLSLSFVRKVLTLPGRRASAARHPQQAGSAGNAFLQFIHIAALFRNAAGNAKKNKFSFSYRIIVRGQDMRRGVELVEELPEYKVARGKVNTVEDIQLC